MKALTRTLAVVLALPLVACWHYATWEHFSRTAKYTAPKQLTLVVIQAESARGKDGGFALTTAEVVQKDLREQGVAAELARAPNDAAPLPRVELSFLAWDDGNPSVQYLSEGLVGHVSISVDVKALGADGSVELQGRITGKQADYAGPLRDAAESAGHGIAKALLDPSYEPARKTSSELP
jgi:hypothetical protein